MKQKIAPAICFEALQPEHLEKAVAAGANLYLASVAKPQGGVEKALQYFPAKALQYAIPIVMTNAIGQCDNFESAGQSSVWGSKGQLLTQLDATSEGLIFYDTVKHKTDSKRIKVSKA